MIKHFMTTEELHTYLGVSMSSVYKLSQKNLLPKYRPTGRKLYFLKQDVDTFLLKNRVASIDELNREIDFEELISRRVAI